MSNLGTNRILLTGAAGWLGLNLVHALARGIPEHPTLHAPVADLKLRCLLLPGQDAAQVRAICPSAEIVTGDVRNAADCQRFCEGAEGGVLFHTAGIIHPGRVQDFYDINLEGTKNLLAAATTGKVRRAVIVSSNSPCGCNPHPDHVFDEESPYNPYMHYGRSKMRMEQAVHAVQGAGRIETVLIRAPWFYGPFQPPRQTLFFEMVRDGKGPIVGGGDNLRSMAYTDNLAQGLWLAAAVPAANGRTYWIADEQPYSMNQVMDTIERLLETEFGQKCAHRRLRLPGVASEVAWVVDKTLQTLGLYHQKFHVLSEMNKTIACTIARAKRELGYQPTIALEEGMRRSLASLYPRK